MVLSNIDSIFFSIDVSNYEEKNADLLQKLEEGKEQAKADTQTDKIIILGDKNFELLPNGARFHAYILHNDTLELKLAQNRSKNGNNYPVSVRIKSLFLWEKGFIDAYMEVIEYLKTIIKGEFIAEKISRADLCCHTDSLKFYTLCDIYESWKGNFRKVEYFTYNRKTTGFTFGSFKEKNVMCRVYDKTLEITTSNKTWFKEIWLKEGMDIENIWNVEFQVGRKFFKNYGVESVQDFILKMRAIWEYLTKEWINYIDLDNSRVERCSIKACWKEIQDAYLNYCYQQIIKREKQVNTKAEELIPLLVGVLTSYGACKQKIVLDRVIDDFKEDMRKYLQEKKENIPIEKIFFDKLEFLFS
ncbi:MAG: hypothetical protein N4A64_11235 [Marinisporobacter sp.]|jgi:hypothetical protein|nr:hypothetical protein [Marinisporobacter sp.]